MTKEFLVTITVAADFPGTHLTPDQIVDALRSEYGAWGPFVQIEIEEIFLNEITS